jgi:hypothetical protein
LAFSSSFYSQHPLLSQAPDRKGSPQFEQYPINRNWSGAAAPIRFKTYSDRLFRTQFRDEAKEPPNFAGHFRVTSWGCGLPNVEVERARSRAELCDRATGKRRSGAGMFPTTCKSLRNGSSKSWGRRKVASLEENLKEPFRAIIAYRYPLLCVTGGREGLRYHFSSIRM